MTARVASLQRLGDATVQHRALSATARATNVPGAMATSPMTAAELRAQLRMQQACNSSATSGIPEKAKVASVATSTAEGAVIPKALTDTAMEARRKRVLAILDENPGFRYAVITDTDAEPGSVVAHIGIRGIGSGEIVIAKARYDGIELLRALENRQAEDRGGKERT